MTENEARACALTNEMRTLLEQNLAQDSQRTNAAMTRVRESRDEIAHIGFLVTWEVNLDLRYIQTPSVTVTLWKPKPNLSPENQQIYDDWFRKMNGIASD